jgi:tetratricopeptide (TPR) repeat protein
MCLAPHPDDRYPTAQALAHDLQAVVEDRPLRWASEPIGSSTVRWARRYRRHIVLALTLGLAGLSTAYSWHEAGIGRERLIGTIHGWIGEGKREELAGRHDLAREKFATAEQMARGRKGFEALAQTAQTLRAGAEEAGRIHAKADRLFAHAGDLRFALLHFGGAQTNVESRLREDLDPLLVLTLDNWLKLPELSLLDDAKRARLIREVEELLFFWSVSLAASADGGDGAWAEAGTLCRRALNFSQTPAPWQALLERCEALSSGLDAPSLSPGNPSAEPSAWACLQWGLLHSLLDPGHPLPAIRWLDQAVRLDPRHYWAQYFLAYHYDRAGQPELALSHYNAAIALEPDRPWALFSRARLSWKRGDWQHALDDLDQSIEKARTAAPGQALSPGDPFPEARLERALVLQRLGLNDAADREYQGLIATESPQSPLGRKARLNRAWLLVDRGDFSTARREYDDLGLETMAAEERALIHLGQVQLALESRRAAEAERLLSARLAQEPRNAQWLGLRARARLMMNRPAEALADAEAAYLLEGTPGRGRWRLLAGLAAMRVGDLVIADPHVLAELPGDRLALRSDCWRCLDVLRQEAAGPYSLRTQAVLLAFLGDPRAIDVADRLVATAPHSVEWLHARAQIHRYLGNTAAAETDMRSALRLEPEDPAILELAGLIALERGEARTALVALDRAHGRGGPAMLLRSRALAYERAGLLTRAARDWTQHIATDPDDIAGFLGRARVMLRRGLSDHALADLESAAGLAANRPDLIGRVVLGYADCLLQAQGDSWLHGAGSGSPDTLGATAPRVSSIVHRIANLGRKTARRAPDPVLND